MPQKHYCSWTTFTQYHSAVILVLFIMNDTVKTPEDVEKYLGLNTLATIPLFEEDDMGKKTKKKGRRKGRR